MQINSMKPFKRKTDGRGKGRRKGQWVLRIRYRTDEMQPWKSVERVFDTYGKALDERPKLEREIRTTHGGFTRGEKMTYEDLTKYALSTYYAPATIKKGVKVDGVKSTASINRHLNALKQFFGGKRISAITTGDLRSYRVWRNKLGSRRGNAEGELGREISETTINRELQTMRRMMKDAHSEGWISRDVFAGAKVIKTAHEKERSRILTASEERRLLEACTGTRQRASKRSVMPITVRRHNEYLRCLIVMACDTGLRKSEMLKLTWEDIDLEGANIHVIAGNSKTERERDVPVSSRASLELQKLPTYGQAGRVFPFEEFKRSWATAKSIAGIEDLHFHDLRSTAITRMIDAGVPLPEVAKIAGHENHTTTVKHYVAMDKDMRRKVGDTINAANEARAAIWAKVAPTSAIMDSYHDGLTILDADTIN
jgi:integrase